ncbi:MAG: sugar-transfer associated ATP-grasp domain-containing protein [Bacteroidales bacterium]|nr:sugar-transfer associated ATP-grasp domain-containing protein [Bacteroidales bacterium]
MNALIKKLRLYRVWTVCKIIPQYYKKSKKIAREHNLSTLPIYWDMMRSLFKFGASDENYEQYHFWEHDDKYKDSFITWRRNMDIMYKFNTPEAKELFLDKVKWNKRFAKYVKRDWLYCKESTIEIITDFLHKHEEVVLKRIDGACGVGIDKYKAQDILSNKKLINQIEEGNVILEEVAVNAAPIRQFSPSSLNTFRFVTCIDHSGVPHIIATAFRMGNGKSHTDNFMTGGIACFVDPETGVIVTDGVNLEGKTFKAHPISGIVYKGFQVPHWAEARNLALSLALEEPKARFVGWDVVMTVHGFDILEGNIPPAEELTELNLKGKYHQVMAMY